MAATPGHLPHIPLAGTTATPAQGTRLGQGKGTRRCDTHPGSPGLALFLHVVQSLQSAPSSCLTFQPRGQHRAWCVSHQPLIPGTSLPLPPRHLSHQDHLTRCRMGHASPTPCRIPSHWPTYHQEARSDSSLAGRETHWCVALSRASFPQKAAPYSASPHLHN